MPNHHVLCQWTAEATFIRWRRTSWIHESKWEKNTKKKSNFCWSLSFAGNSANIWAPKCESGRQSEQSIQCWPAENHSRLCFCCIFLRSGSTTVDFMRAVSNTNKMNHQMNEWPMMKLISATFNSLKASKHCRFRAHIIRPVACQNGNSENSANSFHEQNNLSASEIEQEFNVASAIRCTRKHRFHMKSRTNCFRSLVKFI